jgi:hypothetical protein
MDAREFHSRLFQSVLSAFAIRLQPAAAHKKQFSKKSAFRVTTLGNLWAILEKIKFNI